MSDPYVRPQTPQAMLHRLPDKPDSQATEPGTTTRPSKYIVLITASTAVAGKAQIAKSVADALGCPLFQGDSLHETSARAANVSSSSSSSAAAAAAAAAKPGDAPPGPNKDRYQRMWLSKMTRTGHLFPDESRPANEGFSGFGGAASSSSSLASSRRGSASSVASASGPVSSASSVSNMSAAAPGAGKYINKPPPTVTLSANEKLRRANPALMVTTHPVLEQWHKDSIRHVVGEYGIGVIFVPLDEDEDEDEDDELPVLKPLDPTKMTSFASLGSFSAAKQSAAGGSLEEEIVLSVNVEANVEHLIEDIVDGSRNIMCI
ncbi:unnamed protein product [Discula destructiva]